MIGYDFIAALDAALPGWREKDAYLLLYPTLGAECAKVGQWARPKRPTGYLELRCTPLGVQALFDELELARIARELTDAGADVWLGEDRSDEWADPILSLVIRWTGSPDPFDRAEQLALTAGYPVD